MGRIKYKEAIGLEVKRGRPTERPAPTKTDLVRLYVLEGRSVRDVAEALNCSKDMIHYALKRYGIEIRSCMRRSKLYSIELAVLEAGIKRRGARQYATDLGINQTTLYRHMRTRKGQ